MCRARATALRSCSALALTVLICLVAITPATRAQGPSWVEPRALSIVDIAGQVPDEALQGAFVSYSGLAGISQFTGSRRAADGLEIDVEMSARVFTENGQVLTRLPLLGVRPFQDHMSSAAPASTLFLFEDGQPLTADIVRLNYLEPALAQPAVGSGPPDRYPDLERSIAAPERDGLGIRIPANWGGELVITGDHPVITGTFRLDPLNIPRVTLLGTQEATFQSFIGDFSPGDEGILGELVAQIYRHCQRDEAHPRIPLNPPAGTNYVLFIYPPTPVDPYDLDPDRRNVDRPTTGTLRLAPDEAMLSINLVHSGGFPLRVAWQDADQVLWGDQVPGLPNPPPSERFLSLLPPIDRFTPPEVFAPAGVPFHPCFRGGECPTAVLEDICAADMPIRVLYLSVQTPTAGPGITVLPLRMPDDAWEPAVRATSAAAPPPVLSQGASTVYLPLALRPLPTENRPLGIFDTASGRMIGYIP